MTETTHDAPPPQSPSMAPSTLPTRRLVRDPDDKVVAGVCAAAGRFTGTDPVLWRVVIAALALFGGAGLALYGLAWLLVPRADQPSSFVERHLRRADRSVDVVGVVLLVVVTLVLLALLDEASGVVVLLVVAVLAYLAARERGTPAGAGPFSAGPTGAGPTDPGPTSAVPRAAAAPAAATPAPGGWVPQAPATWPGTPSPYGGPPAGSPPAPGYAPFVPEPRPPRPRSVLGPLTLSIAALVAGVLLLLRQLGVDGIDAPRVLAAAMLVVGVGLVVGTWYGRARWLLAVGLALGLVLVPTALVDDRLADGAGDRTWTPTAAGSPTDYRLEAGEATLDLRELEPGAIPRISADVGLGRLLVLVPYDRRVSVQTMVGLGDVTLTPDGHALSESGGTEDIGPPDGPELELDLHVGLGEIEVRRVEA